jgi:hypothetical protein
VRLTFFALAAVLVAGAGCGREPTDPSRTDIGEPELSRDVHAMISRLIA